MDSSAVLSNHYILEITELFDKITLKDRTNEVSITKHYLNKLASAFKLVIKQKKTEHPLKIDPSTTVALEIYKENALLFGLKGSIAIDSKVVEEIAIFIYDYLCKNNKKDRKTVLLTNFIVLMVHSIDTAREKLIIEMIKQSEKKLVGKIISLAHESGDITDMGIDESFQIILENCNLISLLVFCGRVKQEHDKVKVQFIFNIVL